MTWMKFDGRWPGRIAGSVAIWVLCLGTALAQNQQDSRQNQNYDQNRGNEYQSPSREQQNRTDSQNQRRINQDSWNQEQRDSREMRRDDAQYDQRQSNRGTREDDRSDPSSERRNEQEGGLGVSIVDASGQGVTVVRIHPGSPAEEMGLREGDRITRFNGRQVQSVQGFISTVRNTNPGDRVELDVQRRSGQRSFTGELESRQEALVLRGQNRGDWSEFSQGTGMQSGDQFGRGQSLSARLTSLERQINQISRELDQLRSALRQDGRTARQPSGDRYFDGGETPASYEDSYERTDRSRMSDRDRFDSSGSRQYNDSSRRTNNWDSPGGATENDRLRPGTSDRD